jgi:hypothetical protein
MQFQMFIGGEEETTTRTTEGEVIRGLLGDQMLESDRCVFSNGKEKKENLK